MYFFFYHHLLVVTMFSSRKTPSGVCSQVARGPEGGRQGWPWRPEITPQYVPPGMSIIKWWGRLDDEVEEEEEVEPVDETQISAFSDFLNTLDLDLEEDDDES